MKQLAAFGILTVALLAMIVGCSNNSADSGNDLEEIAAEFGGFAPTNEAPAFGDSYLLSDIDADIEYNDQILLSVTADSVIEESVEEGTYALRIIWGSMVYDSTVTEVTDWTGSLTITRGAEVIRRLIRFEAGQDYIIDRTDRKLIEFVSLTTVHHDGIFVNLYIPPVDSTDSTYTGDPVLVTFETEPFTISFNLEEIAALDSIYYLDDSVNAVSFRGFKIYPHECPKGFLDGQWGVDTSGQGIFRGRWISQHGALAGHLYGIWGVDAAGNETNVFYGKWIDLDGRFQGLLKGFYKPMNMGSLGNGHGHAYHYGGGWLKGRFYDAERNPLGVIHGFYKKYRCDCDDAMGFFKARWKTYCPSIDARVSDGMDD